MHSAQVSISPAVKVGLLSSTRHTHLVGIPPSVRLNTININNNANNNNNADTWNQNQGFQMGNLIFNRNHFIATIDVNQSCR